MRLIRLPPLLLGIACTAPTTHADIERQQQAALMVTVRHTYDATRALATQISAGGVQVASLERDRRYMPLVRQEMALERVARHPTGDWLLVVRGPVVDDANDPGIRCRAQGRAGEAVAQVTCTTLDTTFSPMVRHAPGGQDTVIFLGSARSHADMTAQEHAELEARQAHRDANRDFWTSIMLGAG